MSKPTKSHKDAVLAINSRIFGRNDMYSAPVPQIERIVRKIGPTTAGYLLYKEWPDWIEILRLGTLKEYRKRGIAKRLLAELKRRARMADKPVRTYVAYDNLASYLLHLKVGFYPTHVAWNRFVWIEFMPKK